MNPTYEPSAIDNIVNLIIFLQQKESKETYTIDHKGSK